LSRERDIRRAVQDLLVATGAFSEVYLGSWDERGRAADDLRGCSIEPDRTGKGEGFDAEAWGGWTYDCQITLVVCVRDIDPVVRDEAAEQLLNVVRNTLYGALAGMTLYQKTYIDSWNWLPAQAPERKIRCVLKCPYLEESEQGADESE
jgi:hypothetical protein